MALTAAISEIRLPAPHAAKIVRIGASVIPAIGAINTLLSNPQNIIN
jgi:hypothetical protein